MGTIIKLEHLNNCIWLSATLRGRVPMLGLLVSAAEIPTVPIFDIGQHRSHFMSALLPLRQINVLRQMRQTFDENELQSLAENISVQHLMQPLIVARFGTDQARQHLRVINQAWGTEYTLSQLRPTETEDGVFYFILIAGERRFRAHLLLWTKGCETCKQEYDQEIAPEGFCYLKHFSDDRIPVRIRLNATPSIVLTLQLTENTYVAPPPHEIATAIAEYYPIWKLLNPDGRLKDFATEVNRSEDTLRDYFHYNQLPDFVKEQVVASAIPFGIALELSRLQRDTETDEQLEIWLRKAIAGMFSVTAFSQLINEYLKNKHSGQTSMFDIMNENALVEMERQNIRLIVDQKYSVGLHQSIAYRQRVLVLLETGQIGLKDSPYSSRSVLRLMRKDLDLLRAQTEAIKHLLGPEGYQEANEIITEKEGVLLQLQEIAVRE